MRSNVFKCLILDGIAVISIHGEGSSVSDISSLDSDIPKILLLNQQCVVDILTMASAKNVDADQLDGEDGGSENAVVLKELVQKHVQRMIRSNKLPKDYDSDILYADVVQCLKEQNGKVGLK